MTETWPPGNGILKDTEQLQTNPSQAVRKKSKTTRRAFLVVLVVALVGVLIWKMPKPLPMGKTYKPGNPALGGILYNDERPSAMIDGKILHEGEYLGPYKVINIYRDKVELARDHTSCGWLNRCLHTLTGSNKNPDKT